jgi:hypothetical protein
MKFMIFSSVLFFLFIGDIHSQNIAGGSDSAAVIHKKSNFKLTTRIHSRGMFNFSGRICTDNPAFDLTTTYDRKSWGVLTFSAVDLYDPHSENNFSLTLLYTRIKIGSRVTVTPHTGFSFEDWGKEKGDRQILITSVKINAHMQVDNTMMFPNVFGHRDHDWVNRLRMLYTSGEHLDFIFSMWHNNKVFDEVQYFSTALNTAYNRMKVSEHILLNAGVTVLVMAETSDEEMFPKKNGVVFTIGAVID